MSNSWFDENLRPLLLGCKLEYSYFQNGDFGSLERVEVEAGNKLATVDVWSEGWIGFDIYDLELDDQVMNALFSLDEKELIFSAVEDFLEIMKY